MGIMVIAALIDMKEWIRYAIIITDMIVFLIVTFVMVGIEQKAGYYECKECNHKYVPSYSNVCWAPHFGRTRYMKCPHCGKYSWSKKVIK